MTTVSAETLLSYQVQKAKLAAPIHCRNLRDSRSIRAFPMKAPIRIAVLECDTPLDNTKAKYGGYGGVFEALLLASAKALDQPETVDPQSGLKISKWNVMEDRYPEPEDIDAILITGSSMSHIAFYPFSAISVSYGLSPFPMD